MQSELTYIKPDGTQVWRNTWPNRSSVAPIASPPFRVSECCAVEEILAALDAGPPVRIITNGGGKCPIN